MRVDRIVFCLPLNNPLTRCSQASPVEQPEEDAYYYRTVDLSDLDSELDEQWALGAFKVHLDKEASLLASEHAIQPLAQNEVRAFRKAREPVYLRPVAHPCNSQPCEHVSQVLDPCCCAGVKGISLRDVKLGHSPMKQETVAKMPDDEFPEWSSAPPNAFSAFITAQRPVSSAATATATAATTVWEYFPCTAARLYNDDTLSRSIASVVTSDSNGLKLPRANKKPLAVQVRVCFRLPKFTGNLPTVQRPFAVFPDHAHRTPGHYTLCAVEPAEVWPQIAHVVTSDVLARLPWEPHCLCLRASADPVPFHEHYDPDTHRVACEIHKHFLEICDGLGDDGVVVLTELERCEYAPLSQLSQEVHDCIDRILSYLPCDVSDKVSEQVSLRDFVQA